MVLLMSAIGIASFLYPFFLPVLAGVDARAGRGGIETPLALHGHRRTLPAGDSARASGQVRSG
jgi:hypothetical protein